jgi:hypothetical protein
MKTVKICCGVSTLLTLPWAIYAQGQGAAAIQRKLESEFQLTKTTYDRSDIVTAGSFLVLHKDKVLMLAVSAAMNPCTNTYRDGKIIQGKGCKIGAVSTLRSWSERAGHPIPGADKVPATRNFVSGEKFWVTNINVGPVGKELGAVFEFFTDAMSDVRYRGVLAIPLGVSTPTPDEAMKMVAEVITVVPNDEDAKGGDKVQPAPQGGQQGAAPPPSQPAPPPTQAPAETALAPIEPPPPPPPDPVQISQGETVGQVVAALGEPSKKTNSGTMDIYYYKNVKFTFVNGRLQDAE